MYKNQGQSQSHLQARDRRHAVGVETAWRKWAAAHQPVEADLVAAAGIRGRALECLAAVLALPTTVA